MHRHKQRAQSPNQGSAATDAGRQAPAFEFTHARLARDGL